MYVPMSYAYLSIWFLLTTIKNVIRVISASNYKLQAKSINNITKLFNALCHLVFLFLVRQ